MEIRFDHVTRTVQPLDRDGDEHFGLAPGTNGTGPEMRRTCTPIPAGYTWRRHDGSHALGVLVSPGAAERAGLGEWRSRWDGPAPVEGES